MTPGTGTARRKRVSFGRDVKACTNGDINPLALNPNGAVARKKTAIQQRLEESRATKSKTIPELSAIKETREEALTKPTEPAEEEFDEEEEEEDEEWEDDVCVHDVTVDLNEPHSKSGKYWKSEFTKYTDDARAEMEKLVKYKHLAKRYAEKKDAESLDLNQKLKEEQGKVAKMEKKIKEMASQVTDKRRRGSDTDDAALVKKLAETTALAVQYRDQVKELEAFLQEQDDLGPGKAHRRPINTSPRTEQTLLEVNRELRRARKELKEMNSLREEVERLKSDLLFAQQRANKSGEENKRLVGELSQPSWVQKLEKQLRESKDQTQRKDDELKKLQKEFNALKENAKAQRSQALQVLEEKNTKIAGLEKEVKTLQDRDASTSRPRSLDTALAEHTKITRDLKSDIESLSKPSIHEKAMPRQHPVRSMSAEDLTLDMSQHSFFAKGMQPQLSAIPKESWSKNRRSSADWSTSLTEIEGQLKREKQERMQARKRDRDLLSNDFDIPSKLSERSHKSKTSQLSSGTRRVMSDRVNESSPKGMHGSSGRRVASTSTTSGLKDQAIMSGALDSFAAYRYAAKPSSSRPRSADSETPGIDLVRDRFARLGGPDPNSTALTMNASRCTLPADRLAAAKSRLELKRRGKAGGYVNNKENMRP